MTKLNCIFCWNSCFIEGIGCKKLDIQPRTASLCWQVIQNVDLNSLFSSKVFTLKTTLHEGSKKKGADHNNL